MSYWGYVMDTLTSEDRASVERRRHRRARLRREREDAVLASAAGVLADASRSIVVVRPLTADRGSASVSCARAADVASAH